MARDGSVKSALGAPIVVDGAVWGSVNAASTEERAFPADAEERLARFTDWSPPRFRARRCATS
jgi:GAF domain-containing protein